MENQKPEDQKTIIDLLSDIKQELAVSNAQHATYWDIADIARETKFSEFVVRNKIVTAKGFPRPVILKGTKRRRWIANEITAFLKKHAVRG